MVGVRGVAAGAAAAAEHNGGGLLDSVSTLTTAPALDLQRVQPGKERLALRLPREFLVA